MDYQFCSLFLGDPDYHPLCYRFQLDLLDQKDFYYFRLNFYSAVVGVYFNFDFRIYFYLFLINLFAFPFIVFQPQGFKNFIIYFISISFIDL